MKRNMKRLLLLLILFLTISGCARQTDRESTDDPQETKEELVNTLKVNGYEMNYLHFGNTEGEKLLILPGLSLKSVMGSAQAIEAAYETIGQDYDIYLFDYVRKKQSDTSIEEMANDAMQAMEQLGIDSINLMGVSLGGMVSQCIASRKPELIDRLVLCSTASRNNAYSLQVFENWKKLAEERDANGLMESFGEKVYSPDFYEKYKEIILSGADGASEDDYVNFITSINAIMSFDIYEQLDQIRCPVLVLIAGEDRVFGADASLEMADKLNCERYIYEGYGHGVYDEAVDYLSRIKGFLDEK